MTEIEFRIRSWVRASDQDQRDGLLGWLSVELGPLLIDNVTLRRMASGRIGLSWPCRTAKNGTRHAIVRPVDDDARRSIERQILGQVAKREGITQETDHG